MQAYIVVTSDLGRVTTSILKESLLSFDCGDVRSRTSYNLNPRRLSFSTHIVVTSDLGRVTTRNLVSRWWLRYCGDVRSRTSYNVKLYFVCFKVIYCGDVRSRTSYNSSKETLIGAAKIVVTSDLGRVTTPMLLEVST